ncbi:MAG: astD [Gammaproteobacteria bacterium]|jgi:succinylglutamic semialdehyde dehydrogenase|nr:astD [Gammaproteobacteria bacterium]
MLSAKIKAVKLSEACMKSAGHYIAGKWIQSKSNQDIQAIDPVYKLKIWQGNAASETELKAAVFEARKAFFEWSALSISDRHQKISLLIREISLNAKELSMLMAQESGRPIWLIEESLDGLIYHLTSLSNNLRRPIGTIAVCGSGISLNYIAQLCEVLLYGNSAILYSLPGSYASIEKLMQYWEKLNLPKGLLQLLHGSKEDIKDLAKCQEIDGLMFEGDANSAAMIRLESAQQSDKYLQLCTPSLNPLIIRNISDFENTATQVLRSAFLNSGQETYAAKRLIISTDNEGDNILDALVSMARSLRIAAYDANPQPFMSAMASSSEAQQALSIQLRLQAQGAETLLPMKIIQGGTGLVSAGLSLVPAKLESILSAGPLLQIIRTQSCEEAIIEANRYPSLAAGILTEDEALFNRYKAFCRASQLYHNTPMQNPGRFQNISYPSTQVISGSISLHGNLPGVKTPKLFT